MGIPYPLMDLDRQTMSGTIPAGSKEKNTGPRGPFSTPTTPTTPYPARQPPSHATLPGKITRAAVRRAWNEIVAALADEDFTVGDEPLPTGLDKSVASLLPEPIYIPAVKELNDEVKTSSTATFGERRPDGNELRHDYSL
ncbi:MULTISPECIES: hypothetical protein [Streptomyces]|uniref:Uncharacterized protein n=1 Tax=Streptomyces avermitilis TaxID=33903 RepID=A0A4D4N6Z7_STRAX|nr:MULTISPECIES: hypothetical protein [Streptomyces]BBJ47663.1 hypothetical protein SAVMC3_02920 [Streptomyces avermitilis]GDY69958.1 hypothetical protein SAV14893_093510 [Streptomyces avermitilis]GDY80223.1 hypothetical protein SAV31267_097080 [Streptomyces avermitilis]